MARYQSARLWRLCVINPSEQREGTQPPRPPLPPSVLPGSLAHCVRVSPRRTSQPVRLSSRCPSTWCLSLSLSHVHWSTGGTRGLSGCLSCQVSRSLHPVLPRGVCRPGRWGVLLLGQAAVGMLSRSDVARSWVVGAQVYLKWSVVNGQEVTGGTQASPFRRGHWRPHVPGKRSCVGCGVGITNGQEKKKGRLEPRGCWLLLYRLTEVSSFTPGCNWSSSGGSASGRCPGWAPLEWG